MKKEIVDLQKTILESQTRILEIQAQCLHPRSFPGMYSWRVGSLTPTLICAECGKPLPGITEGDAERTRREYGI